MLSISIDGACRRNGKPNCISAGGVFIQQIEEDRVVQSLLKSNYEIGSTNQRGEMLALLTALDYIFEARMSAHIITDSEYLFNSMTKEWHLSWARKGWITSSGDPVKNKDIWMQISQAYAKCEDVGVEASFYHIKGHCIPFGKVTAQNLLVVDPTGAQLLQAVKKKYSEVRQQKNELFQHALELSFKNNGFEVDEQVLERFITTNIVADAAATRCVEAADSLYQS